MQDVVFEPIGLAGIAGTFIPSAKGKGATLILNANFWEATVEVLIVHEDLHDILLKIGGFELSFTLDNIWGSVGQTAQLIDPDKILNAIWWRART